MTSHVIALDSDGHAGVQTLLPWYANDRLDAAETAAVEAHLAGCAECRAELEWERRMFVAQAAQDDPVGDPEQGLTRLHRQIDPAPAGLAGRVALRTAGWMRWALAAESVAIAALGLWWIVPNATTALPGAYRALGNAPRATVANAIVRFRPETPERAIRAALSKAGARLVDGPTVSDAYLLSLPPGDIAQQLAGLRADPAVALIESLDSAASR